MDSLPPTSQSTEPQRETTKRGKARERRAARQARAQGRPTMSSPMLNTAEADQNTPSAVDRIISIAVDIGSSIRSMSWQESRGQIIFVVGALIALVLVFVVMSTYAGGGILPGVSVGGVNVGGMDQAEAVSAISASWGQDIDLRARDRSWTLSADELGFSVDAVRSAQVALDYGRDNGGLGSMIRSAISGVALDPIYDINVLQARSALAALAAEVNLPAANATVSLQGQLVTHIEAQPGFTLNISELLPALAAAPSAVLERGVIDLPMNRVEPMITDASALVPYAQELLTRPIAFEAYDPVDDIAYALDAPSEEWGEWLTTKLINHSTGPRLYLSVDAKEVRSYLEDASDALPEPLVLDYRDGVSAIQRSVADGSLNTWVTVRYAPIVVEVERGQSAYSISRDAGVTFYMIEQANLDIDLDVLSPGDTINVPSRDAMLPFRPIRSKRIVVDLSEQYMWAYENGEVVFEWLVSSGLPDYPTAPGVYQILSHEEIAFGSSYTLCSGDEDEGSFSCGRWKMHWFMGIYESYPGLMNGFHGAVELPNGAYLGGGQVGNPFTFGCVMAVDDNAQALYNWAEEGVVVEIRL